MFQQIYFQHEDEKIGGNGQDPGVREQKEIAEELSETAMPNTPEWDEAVRGINSESEESDDEDPSE